MINSGTGAYAGAGGSGVYNGHGTAVGCTENSSTVVVTIKAHGPFSFGG